MPVLSSSVSRARPGVSILEVLIGLVVIALVLAVSAPSLRGPSPALRLEREAADLRAAMAEARARAVAQGATVEMVPETPCDDDETGPLVLFSDGTARGPALCLAADEARLRLVVDPLTGRLREAPAP